MSNNTQYKVPRDITVTFILSVVTFFIGMCLDEDAMMVAGLVVVVVLSMSVHILEAIHDLGDKR